MKNKSVTAELTMRYEKQNLKKYELVPMDEPDPKIWLDLNILLEAENMISRLKTELDLDDPDDKARFVVQAQFLFAARESGPVHSYLLERFSAILKIAPKRLERILGPVFESLL